MNRVYRDFILLLFGRLLQIAITLFTLRISTSIMNESELGLSYLMIAIQTFFALFLINPVGQYFNRQTNSWFISGALNSCLLNQSLYVFFISMISFVSLIIARVFGVLDLSISLILIISALVFSQSLNQTIIPMLNMIGRRYAFVFFNLFTALLCAACSFTLLLYWSNNASSWLMGIVVGCMVANACALLWVRGNVKLVKSTGVNVDRNIRKILLFALPIAFSTLFMWFLGSGYRVLVDNYYGLEFLAVLGVGVAVSSQIFSVIESLLSQYLIPSLYRNVDNVSKDLRLKFLNQYISTVIPIYVSLAIFLTFSIEYIFSFLVAEKYYSSYMFAVYAVWVELFRVLTNVFSITGQIEKVTSRTILPYVAGAVFLASIFTLNYYLKLEMDVMHLLIASNAIVLVYMGVKMNSLQRFSLPIKNISIFGISATPSVLFFMWANIPQVASIKSFILLCIGALIYLLGFMFSLGKLKNA